MCQGCSKSLDLDAWFLDHDLDTPLLFELVVTLFPDSAWRIVLVRVAALFHLRFSIYMSQRFSRGRCIFTVVDISADIQTLCNRFAASRRWPRACKLPTRRSGSTAIGTASKPPLDTASFGRPGHACVQGRTASSPSSRSREAHTVREPPLSFEDSCAPREASLRGAARAAASAG